MIVIGHELAFFSEARPSHVSSWRGWAFGIHEDFIIACLHVDDLDAHCLACEESWTRMIDDSKKVLIADYGHDGGALAQ